LITSIALLLGCMGASQVQAKVSNYYEKILPVTFAKTFRITDLLFALKATSDFLA